LKITNETGIPQAIVDSIENDPYDAGASDISVTRLIAPARAVALQAKHKDELVIDAADMLYALMGKAMHYVLENAGDPLGERVIERRFFAEVEGWTLSGQIDLWENGTLDDYKFTSVWETIHGLKEEKIAQLNILAWLCRQDGLEVNKVRIVALYRDWSRTKAMGERDYPQHQIGIIEAPMWPEEKTLAYIKNRIKIHQDAREKLPLCTEDEQWAKPTKYALMKEGRKSALRLLDSPEEVMLYAETNKHAVGDRLKAGFYIEKRPGEKTRCESYCAAAPFCSQFNDGK
jgi:hypothetical protein